MPEFDEVGRLRAWLRLIQARTGIDEAYYALHGYDKPTAERIEEERQYSEGAHPAERVSEGRCQRCGNSWALRAHEEHTVDGLRRALVDYDENTSEPALRSHSLNSRAAARASAALRFVERARIALAEP